MEECKQCGEIAVETDSHFSQEQLVCKACGAIQSEGSFTNENQSNANGIDGRQLNNLPWRMQKTCYKGLPAGLKISLKKLEILASAFSVPSFLKAEANKLLQTAFQNPAFHRLHLEKKKALAACCIYIIFRQNNWPVTISSLCNLAEVGLHVFNDVFQNLLLEFKITFTTTPIEELAVVYLKNAVIDPETIKKCIQIIEFARDVWITRSNKPDGIISAAAYIAWMANDVNQRNNKAYKHFCQHCNVPLIRTAPLRYKELLNMLTLCAEKLPWMEERKLKKKEVLHVLDDVLKYSKTLRASIEDEDNSSNKSSCYVQNTKKRKTQDESSNICEGNLIVSNSPELTEDDIPSDEMHKYLRSTEEIEQVKEIMNRNRELL